MTRTKQMSRGRKKGKAEEGAGPRDTQAKVQHQQKREKLKVAKTAPQTKPQSTNPQPSEDTTAATEEPNSLSLQDTTPKTSTESNALGPQTQPANIAIPPQLLDSYAITTMSIISSSQMQQKVTKALSLLSTYPTVPPAKPVVVVLYAKSKAAAKMVSVAEIVKREIAALEGEGGKGQGKWFQYNWVEGFVDEKKDEKEMNKGKEERGGKEDVEMGDGEEEGFEVMKTPFERAIEGTKKVRILPVMSIYLSRVRIESLRGDYGEQTNALQ